MGSRRRVADDPANARVRYDMNTRNICSSLQITDFESKCHVLLRNFTGKITSGDLKVFALFPLMFQGISLMREIFAEF